MVLAERGWFERAPIEILASDASHAALAKAAAGRYSGRSFRNLSSALREKYFERSGEEWIAAPALRRHVTYDHVNLVDATSVARHGSAPIVFCRNVFIYFSDRAIRRTVDAFAEHMPEVGYLCLGASESLLRLRTRFDLREIGGAFVYVKQPGGSDALLASNAGARASVLAPGVEGR
jgi:chemotaxis protein methyltransferase CheR